MNLEPAHEPGELPLRIHGYRVVRRLGSAQAAEVYLARDEQAARWVVVTRLVLGPGVSSHGRKRFRTEVLAATKLEHPAIARIFETFEEGPYEGLVAEFIQGRTIARRLSESGFDQSSVIQIALQLASGLQVAHDQGIVHRDLRAENVLLTPSGAAKILYFGVARRLGASAMAAEAWHNLRALSPEQVRGKEALFSADYFALGVLIYEMVARRNPFIGRNLEETFKNIQHQLPAPLGLACPGVHPKLSILVDWLLQKDPTRRPESAQDLIAALSEMTADVSGACCP